MSTRHYDGTALYHAAFGWAAAFLGFTLSYRPTLIDCDKRLAKRSVTA
jgi:hypothetical protein